jgi:hypothetical protein
VNCILRFVAWLYSNFYKFEEKRVRGKRAGFEFGVELGAEEEGVNLARKLGDFHEPAIGGLAGENEAAFF